MAPGGAIWLGVPCNSLGVLAATASYGRTNQNPDGDANAQAWNEIIRRSFWLAAAALELNSEPLFENPKDTLGGNVNRYDPLWGGNVDRYDYSGGQC